MHVNESSEMFLRVNEEIITLRVIYKATSIQLAILSGIIISTTVEVHSFSPRPLKHIALILGNIMSVIGQYLHEDPVDLNLQEQEHFIISYFVELTMAIKS